jgi:type IV secretory pathway VirJ component
MKPIWSAVALLVILTAIAQAGSDETTVRFEPFGKIALYQTSARPNNVVIFISGDGGWNLGVVDMARALSKLDALVAGIDINDYLRALAHTSAKCAYPAADFENLSKFIQKSKGFAQYRQPVLVGYSSGATLAYAVLAQAPPNTFRGAVSLGFCPDLVLAAPLCRGSGLQWQEPVKGKTYLFLPADHLTAPWIAFQGTIDKVCNAVETEQFAEK